MKQSCETKNTYDVFMNEIRMEDEPLKEQQVLEHKEVKI
jgi:hypothetical protein